MNHVTQSRKILKTCSKCSRDFPEYRSPEERLLQAIFGETLCKQCFDNRESNPCTLCGEQALASIYYNNEPYHLKCLAEKFNL